ncbi:MAG: GPW/gp25 family protein [bacterium]|nr:GPW/gp25 family protein [bacterium]
MMAGLEHLGTDLAFDEVGDLLVSASGDLALVSGRDCLLRDLADALRTQPGELFPHPEYGCGMLGMLGANDTPLNRTLAQRFITKTLENDQRVKQSTIQVELLSFGSEEKTFQARFEAVGDSETHTLVWGYGIKSIDDLKRNSIVV